VACTSACPTLTPVTATSMTCEERLDDCSDCGPGTCGPAVYAYGCSGTGGPPLAGCYATGSSTEYCCTPAACIRTTLFDSYCSALSLPPNGYSCHVGATPAAGCVLFPSGSEAPGYCCP
jgi:hypothetical protein